MQKRSYLTGGLQETTDAAGPVTQSLIKAIEYEHLTRWRLLTNGIAHAKQGDGVPAEDIENLVLGALMFQVASSASAMAAVHTKAFDPVDFGKFAERIAHEFAGTFERINAEEDARTATKN